jgi:hypothetical protein
MIRHIKSPFKFDMNAILLLEQSDSKKGSDMPDKFTFDFSEMEKTMLKPMSLKKNALSSSKSFNLIQLNGEVSNNIKANESEPDQVSPLPEVKFNELNLAINQRRKTIKAKSYFAPETKINTLISPPVKFLYVFLLKRLKNEGLLMIAINIFFNFSVLKLLAVVKK